MKNILYVISGETGFKKTDESILRDIGSIKKINYRSYFDYLSLKQITNYIRSDVVIIWFASMHALPYVLLKLFFEKPIIVIAGGYDVAKVPSINYGSMSNKIKGFFVRLILNKADKIVAVSKSNRKEILNNVRINPQKVNLIYNAIKFPKNDIIIDRSKQILTVGEINEETILRKGLDRFLCVAKKMKDISFIHAGKWTDIKGKSSEKAYKLIKSKGTDNITFLGFVPDDQLIELYKKSKIYIQLSRHEAFGVSVAEAMSYGCIPIVTDAYALPEIVNGHGLIVDSIRDTISKIKMIMNDEVNFPCYNNQFSITKRKECFQKLLNK